MFSFVYFCVSSLFGGGRKRWEGWALLSFMWKKKQSRSKEFTCELSDTNWVQNSKNKLRSGFNWCCKFFSTLQVRLFVMNYISNVKGLRKNWVFNHMVSFLQSYRLSFRLCLGRVAFFVFRSFLHVFLVFLFSSVLVSLNSVSSFCCFVSFSDFFSSKCFEFLKLFTAIFLFWKFWKFLRGFNVVFQLTWKLDLQLSTDNWTFGFEFNVQFATNPLLHL